MIDQTPISEIMSTEVVIVDADDTIRETESLFRNYLLRHAPVINDGKLVGMLSLVDLKRSENQDSFEEEEAGAANTVFVKHLMTKSPVTVQLHAYVHEVAALFVENEFHAIPVLDGDRIVGIVSTTDVIRFYLDR